MKANCFLLLTLVILTNINVNGQVIIDLVECNSSCFWSTGEGEILKWDLDPSTIGSFEIEFNQTCESLAIGYVKKNIDTSYNTFICTDFTGNGETTFWDGQSWLNLGIPNLLDIVGIGSSQNHLYLASGVLPNIPTFYYDGDLLSSFDPGYKWAIADIAVDNVGRGWCVSAKVQSFDSLIVLDNKGVRINAFPFTENIHTDGVYGMTIVNDTILIGFNETNNTFPLSIISVTIENDIATVQESIIDMSQFDFRSWDLASNTSGNPLNMENSVSETTIDDRIHIYPNPTAEFVVIDDDELLFENLRIFDLNGLEKAVYEITEIPFKIDLVDYPSGSYYMKAGKRSVGIIKI